MLRSSPPFLPDRPASPHLPTTPDPTMPTELSSSLHSPPQPLLLTPAALTHPIHENRFFSGRRNSSLEKGPVLRRIETSRVSLFGERVRSPEKELLRSERVSSLEKEVVSGMRLFFRLVCRDSARITMSTECINSAHTECTDTTRTVCRNTTRTLRRSSTLRSCISTTFTERINSTCTVSRNGHRFAVCMLFARLPPSYLRKSF